MTMTRTEADVSLSTLGDLSQELVETARLVVESGAISRNGHGNISIRVPGTDQMLFTAAETLFTMGAERVVRIRLDNTLLEGSVPPVQAAVIAMHTTVLRERPDVNCVIHTHSPFATAFAVARKPIRPWVEAMGMFGMDEGVPVAGYGARGSEQAVANIRAVLTPTNKGVLLANHGVLNFGPSTREAVRAGSLIEEAAQEALYAMAIGGPVEIPPDLLASSRVRSEHFQAQGTLHAGHPHT